MQSRNYVAAILFFTFIFANGLPVSVAQVSANVSTSNNLETSVNDGVNAIFQLAAGIIQIPLKVGGPVLEVAGNLLKTTGGIIINIGQGAEGALTTRATLSTRRVLDDSDGSDDDSNPDTLLEIAFCNSNDTECIDIATDTNNSSDESKYEILHFAVNSNPNGTISLEKVEPISRRKRFVFAYLVRLMDIILRIPKELARIVQDIIDSSNNTTTSNPNSTNQAVTSSNITTP